MRIMMITLLYILSLSSFIDAEVNFSQDDFKTSIIIPCSYRHAGYLYNLLKLYEVQTVLPDEVVISLSEGHLVSEDIIERIHNEPWPFPVKLLITHETLFAGLNRNNACEHARGDLLICQDADDLPHIQRVEIIKYFFKTYNADHIMHGFVDENNAHRTTCYYDDLSTVPFLMNQSFLDLFERFVFHNGNVAIAKHVWQKIRWTASKIGEDALFNQQVYGNFTKCLALEIPLLVYRVDLSATILR